MVRHTQDLKNKHGLREGNLSLPREIILLNGAPGSGKGANSPFIVSTMGASRVVRRLPVSPQRPQRATLAAPRRVALHPWRASLGCRRVRETRQREAAGM